MKTIIAGSRDFTDTTKFYDLMYQYDQTNEPSTLIISGHARGADQMGEEYADNKGIKCSIIPANWDKHGKSAGYKRNTEMAKMADRLIAFWDGKSKGTGHMIDIMLKLNKEVVVYKV